MCKYLPLGFDRDDEGRVIRVRESMYMYAGEAFYGFGEKFTEFNKRGQKNPMLAEGCIEHQYRGFLQKPSVFHEQQRVFYPGEQLYQNDL